MDDEEFYWIQLTHNRSGAADWIVEKTLSVIIGRRVSAVAAVMSYQFTNK